MSRVPLEAANHGSHDVRDCSGMRVARGATGKRAARTASDRDLELHKWICRRDMTRERRRALICGTGVAGLTLASQLGRCGWQVVLIESGAALRGGGFAVDLTPEALASARQMGVLPQLRSTGELISRVRWVDGGGRNVADVDLFSGAAAQSCWPIKLLRSDLESAPQRRLPCVLYAAGQGSSIGITAAFSLGQEIARSTSIHAVLDGYQQRLMGEIATPTSCGSQERGLAGARDGNAPARAQRTAQTGLGAPPAAAVMAHSAGQPVKAGSRSLTHLANGTTAAARVAPRRRLNGWRRRRSPALLPCVPQSSS